MAPASASPSSTKRRIWALLLRVGIPAVGSIVVAAITAYATIAAGTSKLQEASQGANDAAKKASLAAATTSAVTVGAIVASALTPEEFAQAAGDPQVFDPAKSRWAVAANQQVIGSAYHTLFGRRLPDLRGMFLRGANLERNDSFKTANRDLGAADAWGTAVPHSGKFSLSTEGEHVHYGEAGKAGFVGAGQGAHAPVQTGSAMPAYGGYAMTPQGSHSHSVSGWDEETRPNNVTVNYFVRINP
ncbi:MAG: hypothetical protein AB7I50_20840 [Vicinamibacterales bacterium]